MSEISGQEPEKHARQKPPRRHWQASEPFFDLKLSHIVTVGLTAALVFVGICQLSVYNRQTKIMGAQTKISENQLTLSEQEERPWIAVSIDPSSFSATWESGALRFTGTIDAENDGGSPAVNTQVAFVAGHYMTQALIPKLADLALGVCEKNIDTNVQSGIVIFPKVTVPGGYSQKIPQSDILGYLSTMSIETHTPVSNYIQFDLILCAAYRNAGDPVEHYTAIPLGTPLMPIGQNFNRGDIGLFQFPFGTYAN